MEPSASNQPSAAGLGWAQTQGPRASSWSSSSAREQVLGGPASPNVGVTPKLCGECAPQSPERSMGLLPNGSSGRGRDSRAGQVAAEALLSFLDRSPAHTLDTVLSRSSAPPWTLLLLPSSFVLLSSARCSRSPTPVLAGLDLGVLAPLAAPALATGPDLDVLPPPLEADQQLPSDRAES